MTRIRGLGKRRKIRIRISDEIFYTIIRAIPIIIMIIFTIWLLVGIGGVTAYGNLSHSNGVWWIT